MFSSSFDYAVCQIYGVSSFLVVRDFPDLRSWSAASCGILQNAVGMLFWVCSRDFLMVVVVMEVCTGSGGVANLKRRNMKRTG